MSAASPSKKDGVPASLLAIVAGLGGCLLWAYWPTLGALENRWANDPQSSHGFLVPVFAALVLWARRSSFPAGPWSINLAGLAFLVAAALLRLGGAYLSLDWFDGFSLLLSLTGVGVLAGGWKLLRWAWPGLVLLLFMLPLPYQIEIALANPLQRAATVAATYTLQTLGYPAIAEGNVIVINELRIGVIEACSGLGMLAAFFAVSTAVAFVIERPWYEKGIVFASAIPVGLFVNLIRITAMGWAHLTFGSRVAEAVFHGYPGYLLMPLLALLTLWLELFVLKRLVVIKTAARPVPVFLPRPAAQAIPPAASERTGSRTQLVPQPAPATDGLATGGR